MKQYLHYFRWVFLGTGLLALVLAGILVMHGAAGGEERINGEALTKERVFDYGGVLTDEEEGKLRELIARREKQTGCDIVLVTRNETLEKYAEERGEYVPCEELTRVYAESFYEENKLGYDKPNGDGVILVDNWFREADGNIYTWLCVTGKAKEKYGGYGSAMTDHLLDNVYRYVERNPYKAYKTYVNEFYHDMRGQGMLTAYLPYWLPAAGAAAAMLVFVILHWSCKKGRKTVRVNEYVNGGKPRMNKQEDIFLNKVVTRRHIPKSDGGGSGGSGGGGGGSHGGGGHSR